MKINVQLSSINVKKINTMRKFMNMPDVKVVRFENKDVIVTSEMGLSKQSIEDPNDVGVQERRSIWD